MDELGQVRVPPPPAEPEVLGYRGWRAEHLAAQLRWLDVCHLSRRMLRDEERVTGREAEELSRQAGRMLDALQGRER